MKKLSLMFFFASIALTMVSCDKEKKDEGENLSVHNLKGMWYTNESWYGGSHQRVALDIRTSSSAIYYSTIDTNPNGFANGSAPLGGYSGWYYGTQINLNYEIEDDQVVMYQYSFSAPYLIFTYRDGCLYDNSGNKWVKWI